MANLEKIKESLITLDYPGIKSMKTEENIINVISPTNRKTFLKWVFVKLDPTAFLALNEGEIAKNLPKLVDNHGLCSDEETTKFVDGTLDYETQLKIIERILSFLIICLSPTEETDISHLHIDLDSILKQIDKVFPNLQSVTGDCTKLDEKLKKEKETSLKELEELQKTEIVDLALEEINEPDLDELKSNINKFHIKSALIKDEPKKIIPENQTIKVPDKLKQELNEYVKMQDDIDVIDKFNEKMSSIDIDNNVINEKIEELVILSKEVLKNNLN